MKKRIILICSLASSLAYSQVGIKTSTPTNTLDVNGTARVRQVDPGLAATALTPLYANANNVVVKIPNVGNYALITNSVEITAGSTANIISNLPYGAYKVTVTVGDGCTNTASVDFFVHNYINSNAPATAYHGVNAQGGLVTRSATNNKPSFNQIGQNKVIVSWTGVEGCQDGGNSTSLDYSMGTNPGKIYIINNGNVTRFYRINATRLD